ncbi:MAG: sigma-70 family RNA polymerase sigma factor [Acidobacteria bacterium]|nr:sigma-70 family RNA polymerase sigma factor [Acidobacteriota bacterium]
MAEDTRPQVTRLLMDWRAGDESALDRLMPLVYSELHTLAARCLSSEQPGQTLRATALVHEAYLRLVGSEIEWRDRAHFYALSARLMRRILVDHARMRNREKRGGGAYVAPLDEAAEVAGPGGFADLLAIDHALAKLAEFDARKSSIIEMHFFGGMTHDEIAEAMQISAPTVYRDLKLAEAWLRRELTTAREHPAENSSEA